MITARHVAFPVVLMWLAPAVFAQSQPIGLQAIDANQRVVGTVLDVDDPRWARTALDFDGHILVVSVGRTGLGGPLAEGVYFASADCTGQAYASWTFPSILEPQSVAGPSNTVYWAPTGSVQMFTVNSRLPPGGACEPFGPAPFYGAVAVNPIGALTPPFEPPFSLAPISLFYPVPTLSPSWLILLAGLIAVAGVILLGRQVAGRAA
jgi:hypothetical protein